MTPETEQNNCQAQGKEQTKLNRWQKTEMHQTKLNRGWTKLNTRAQIIPKQLDSPPLYRRLLQGMLALQ